MSAGHEMPVGVYLVDDDQAILSSCAQSLQLAGFPVRTFNRAAQALGNLQENCPAIIVSDIRMPEMDGLALLKQAVDFDPELPVILLTGHGDVELAVGAMRMGAWDFLQKPLQPSRLIESVKRAVLHREVVLENRSLHREVQEIEQNGILYGGLIGNAPSMVALKDAIKNLAQVDANVLIRGETGAGKEAVARRLHDSGPRKDRNFVALNCGAMPLSIIESELFGHEKGAFTGAQNRRVGRLEHANGGTLFLDEVESMPMDIQVRFLRVLQDRVVEPIGGNRSVPLDIRVVAAAKADLYQLAQEGTFRADLYYRLHVAELSIPPLRDRKEDIPLLFRFFVEKAARRLGKTPPPISSLKDLEIIEYAWPGNVRELISAAERHVLGLPAVRMPHDEGLPQEESTELKARLEAYEKAIIMKTLAETEGSMQRTADSLGIPYKTLYLRLRKYGIDKKELS
ncbi:sigma-54-dependent transcriptional regulator [Sneathiella aquimaris]|uniref:sigma-54-dependent transcriptional regulator n=1 Tax=Sneathiella aquimaris TaxID=2599305 RepID=UPI00146C6AA3|nr:sigma-54 dependent transcriptional regulator [Sneathiella aquimaris]